LVSFLKQRIHRVPSPRLEGLVSLPRNKNSAVAKRAAPLLVGFSVSRVVCLTGAGGGGGGLGLRFRFRKRLAFTRAIVQRGQGVGGQVRRVGRGRPCRAVGGGGRGGNYVVGFATFRGTFQVQVPLVEVVREQLLLLLLLG
jgi:hypothetical protein